MPLSSSQCSSPPLVDGSHPWFSPFGRLASKFAPGEFVGVLVPNSPLRSHVMAMVGQKPSDFNASSKPKERTSTHSKVDDDNSETDKGHMSLIKL